MAISFVVITIASFMCAFAPHPKLGFEISYAFFVLGRFLLACATRGVALTAFVIGMYCYDSVVKGFCALSLSSFSVSFLKKLHSFWKIISSKGVRNLFHLCVHLGQKTVFKAQKLY